jgi:hypothetical protein
MEASGHDLVSRVGGHRSNPDDDADLSDAHQFGPVVELQHSAPGLLNRPNVFDRLGFLLFRHI